MADAPVTMPILIRDLCGDHFALCDQPGAHTITGPEGLTDLVITAADPDGDGKPNSVQVTKYGRFQDTKVPQVTAFDEDGNGTVDRFYVVAERWSNGEVAEDIEFIKVSMGGYFRTESRFHNYSSGDWEDSVYSTVGYHLTGFCEDEVNDDWLSLCSWLNEGAAAKEEPAVKQVPASVGSHPSRTAMSKYMKWCHSSITTTDDQELKITLKINHQVESNYDREGIITRHRREDDECSAVCTVEVDGVLLREVKFKSDQGKCGEELSSALVNDYRGGVPTTQQLPVDVALTSVEQDFRPGTNWAGRSSQYCSAASIEPRDSTLPTNFDFIQFVDATCDMDCTSKIDGHLVSSTRFIDADCNGYPEERKVTHYPLKPTSGADPKTPLYTEVVPMHNRR